MPLFLNSSEQTSSQGAGSLAPSRARGPVYLRGEWNEEDHPREDNGQFAPAGGGGSGSSDKPSSSAGPAAPASSPTSHIKPAAKGPWDEVPNSYALREKDFEPNANSAFSKSTAKANEYLGFAEGGYGNPLYMGGSQQRYSGPELKAQVSANLAKELSSNPDWQALVANAQKSKPGYQSKDVASHMVHRWAATSGDDDDVSVAVQAVAKEEFEPNGRLGHLKGAGSALDRITWKGSGSPFAGMSKEQAYGAIKGFLHAQYKLTQESLKKEGINEVYLLRGIRQTTKQGKDVVQSGLKLQPLSSFSSNAQIARNFSGYGGRVMVARIPRERIMSTPRTGNGCLNEHEWVILGNHVMSISISSSLINTPAHHDIAKHARKYLADKKAGKKPKEGVIYITKGDPEDMGPADDTLYPDDDLINADWVKQAWDLPPYKSEEFNQLGYDLEKFRKLPVYQHAVDAGLIKHDEWVGEQGTKSYLREWDEDKHPRDEQGRFTDAGGGGSGGDSSGGTEPSAGSSGWSTAQSGVLPSQAQPKERAAAMEQIARSELDKLGMQDQKLAVHQEPGRLLTELGYADLGHDGWREGANFAPGKRGGNPDNRGTVNLFANAGNTVEELRAMIKHEALHARQHYAERKSARPDSFYKANFEALQREDGTTEYSRAYWQRYAAFKAQNSLDQYHAGRSAIHESLAEMHAYDHVLPPTYAKLDKLVQSIWDERKPRKN